MFFMIGVTNGRKDFDFQQTVICEHCGSYGRYQVFMTYMCLSLFFIPILKWNRQYFVQMSCCNCVYELDAETGRRIAMGEQIKITLDKLRKSAAYGNSHFRRCNNCGFTTEQDFAYCPKCGQRF